MTDNEQRSIFAKNLNKYILRANKTQFEIANAIGVSPQTFNTWVKGIAIPRMGKIQKLADYFLINKSDLIDEKLDALEGLTNIILPAAYPLPILGEICAGNGILCEENYQGTFYVDKSIKADFCLAIKGDSMKEANIFDGDMVFIRKNFDFSDGKIYAVRIEDECEAVLKKVYKDGEHVLLNPCNSEYLPIIKPAQDVSILGECVGTFHNIK